MMTSQNNNDSMQTRILPSPIGPVIPVADLEEMIGYSRSAINKALKDYKEKIDPCKTFLSLPTPGGPQQCACLNRTGVDYLIILIHPSKARMDLDKLVEFRRAIFAKMDCGELPGHADVDLEIREARRLADLTDGDPRAFQAAALRKCGMPEYAEALLKSGPAVIHGEAGWYSPTQLGKRCGLTGKEVNSWLYNHGYQYPERYGGEDRIWRLQPKGEPFGREYPFTAPSGHIEIRISWRETILTESGLKKSEPAALPAAGE